VREPADHDPAAGLLRGEAAKPAVEDERGIVGEEAATMRLGWDEEPRRDVHEGRRLGEYTSIVK
jgi:hypothetical protein